MKVILITGSSGFIGFHLAKRLLEKGDIQVIGFDNENDYYDIKLKQSRRDILTKFKNFTFYLGDIINYVELENIFKEHHIYKVCHLAAQAGVRYSIDNPKTYIDTNIIGFYNIIELSKIYNVKNFIYASSSSVYGLNKKQPFSVTDNVDNPISLYAVTKKTNELIAHTYSHLFNLHTTGLRFFTVQGPYGRPDMAYFKFTQKIINGEPIDIHNNGEMERDFTDIEDIVDGIILSIDCVSKYEIFNLGNNTPTTLEDMISLLEQNIGIKAKRNYIGMQDGDVKSTWADIEHTKEVLGWESKIKIEDTVKVFVEWYTSFYSNKI